MGYTYYFEKLEIWNLAIDLSVYVYGITQKFPPEEKFGLTNQIRRASNSISANIAEGVHRKSNKEKKRFLEIAYSSNLEVLSHSILASRLKYLSIENAQLL
jgi:four helix bundle protein